jgi:Mycotoxin biosynthesis protein UstYa
MLTELEDHCLEILRKNIQCTADVGLFTFYMLEGDPLPWPELNSWHTCRNFDRVRDWALENSVGNMERPDAVRAGL